MKSRTELFETFAIQGMSLRDYFAAMALQGLLANAENDGYKLEFAESAYGYADAMLKARNNESR